MRVAVTALLLAGFIAGCKHGPARSGHAGPKSDSLAARAAVAGGKIAFVNPRLRYVIIDFSLGQMPAVDQRLGVFRNGQKVGEIKVTGPSRNQNTAADLLLGEASVGDDVR